MLGPSHSNLAIATLAFVFTAHATAFNPATDPVLEATRTLLDSWAQDGTEYAIYGYGTYSQVVVTLAPPPWSNTSELTAHETITTWEGSNGTTLEEINFHSLDPLLSNETLSLSTRALEARACKRSCVAINTYYWGEESTDGTWFQDWVRTDAKGYNGGEVQFCNDIIIAPTFSGSIGVGYGIISGILGISPDPLSSRGYCYGCVARTTGDKCSRLWYQAKMNWKEGNLWRHETKSDNGLNACCICTGEYDRNVLIGKVHADWPVKINGIPFIVPGCSPCSD